MVQPRPGAAPPSSTGGSSARLSGGAIVSVVGVVLLVIFMVQNRQSVTVHFLFWDVAWPLWLLTLVTAVVGALVWFGAGVLRRHRRRKSRREARDY